MKHWILVLLCLSHVLFAATEEEKIINVPSEMTVELILANENGVINGTHNVRARLFDPNTLERVWFENYQNQPIVNGSMVLKMNSVPSINTYTLHKKKLKFVVSVEDQPVEIPLLTTLYSYRSKFAEFGWDTRFHSILFIDRTQNYMGFGTQTPKGHVDIVGAIKLAYEDTNVTGAIRWENNSLRVKHPTKWIDLLYGPTTFIKSRWAEYSNNIQLVSSNYRVGIGTKFPQEQLHVTGSGYFGGDLKSESLQASAFNINSFALTNTLLKTKSIHLRNGSNVTDWTKDNLRVTYGNISGNGDGLTFVGQNQKDFGSQMIQTHHLDGEVITSRNIKTDAIKATHFLTNSLLVDRMVPLIFNGDVISNNAITSKNIMTETLTFDMLITNNVTEFIPDNFFTSDKIAPNSINTAQLKDRGIASYNIKQGIFGLNQFVDNIILGNVHVTPNSISYDKFATGEIKNDLFSGVMTLGIGGTGLSALKDDRVLTVTTNMFNTTTNMYVNAAKNVGLFGSYSLNALQKTFPYLFTVGSLTTSVNVHIKDTGNQHVSMAVAHPNQAANISMLSSGLFSIGQGVHQFFIHPTKVFSTLAANAQQSLDLGSALTIGDATNSEPKGGTMEYEAPNGRFRFYNGTAWKIVSDRGFGIGNPSSINNRVAHRDSFIGSSSNSSGVITTSAIGQLNHSDVTVSHSLIDDAILSTIDGQKLVLSGISETQLKANRLHASDIVSSKLNVQSSQLFGVHESQFMGTEILADRVVGATMDVSNGVLHHVNHVVGRLDDSVLRFVNHSDVYATHSRLDLLDYARVNGSHNLLTQADGLALTGDSNSVLKTKDLRLMGDLNTIISAQGSQLSGDHNFLFGASDSLVHGNSNRLFGDHHHIIGQRNVAIGSSIAIKGQGNIVLNADSNPLHIHGDEQVVFNAPNGVFFQTGEGMLVQATADSGGWAMVSDRELKTKFIDVNHQQMFERLMSLPISEWEYVFKSGVKHVGPMAQDFKQAFNVGEDDRFITASDADGVAFSAIKYLIEAIDTINNHYSTFQFQDIQSYEQALDFVDQLMVDLDQSINMKKNALEVMADHNLEQYQFIDQQFKIIDKLGAPPSLWLLILQSSLIFVVMMSAILLGFFSLRLYHRNEEK